MPWLFNPQNMAQTLTMRNGRTLRLPARKKHYLAPELMSGDVHNKAARGIIRNLGEDRVVKRQEVKSDTSSKHHQSHGMVGAVSEESVALSRSKFKRGARRKAQKNASTPTSKKKKFGE